MVQEYPACGGELDTTSIPQKVRRTNFMLKIADLAAQRGLSDMQHLFCRKLEASRFGDSYKVTKMPEFQMPPLPRKHSPSA
jgi:hypothetical protein